MTTLQFETDASGNRWLRDKQFNGVTFDDLNLNTPTGSTLLLERLSFLHCKTDPGTCWIGGHTTLQDILIEDLECGDTMRFDSNCRFERVVLRQKKQKGKLLITPGDAGLPCKDEIGNWCLDITEFNGAEVVVVGLPADRVRINPDRHVIVHRNWRYQLDWALLGLNRLGFIGITTKKVDVHARETGIFSLPDPVENNRHYREAVAEIDLLRRAGIAIG